MVSDAAVQLEQGHDAFVVAASLSFDSVETFTDHRADWHHKYALAPQLRAMVYWNLMECSATDLHNSLSTDDRAQTLGYDPNKFSDGNDAPHRTTLYRAWNDYLGEELKQAVNEACQGIREYAREADNLIGSQTVATEEKENVSTRSKYRFKRRKTHEVAEKFRELFYDELELKQPADARYTKEDLFDLFLHMAFSSDFANSGGETWQELVEDKATAPSGETLRDSMRDFDELHEREVTEMFDAVSEVLWSMADRLGYLDGYVDIAVDSHAWLFYGSRDTPRISEAIEPKRGTDRAYEFLTLSVVGDQGEKFVIGFENVASEAEKRIATKQLVNRAKERLFVRDIYADRGFYGTLFAKALLETGENFVIRANAGAKSKKMWEEAEDGVKVERVTMSRSRAPYVSVTVTRFVIAAPETADAEYISFITNRKLTRRQAKRIGEAYRRRWGIETSFRVVIDFLPKTASKDFALRQYYYRLAVLLYNVWILVNAVVAESIGHPPEASPPVTAKYLLVIMRKKHDEQGFT